MSESFDPSRIESRGDMERYTMEKGGRVYFDHNGYYPSVSTVLDEKPTPVGVKRWMENNDDWREQRDFKGNRGTMVHYNILNEFAEEELWGQEESSSIRELRSDWEDWDRYQDDFYWSMERAWSLIRQVLDIRVETVKEVEYYVKNEDVGYAGQFDLLYSDPDGKVVLADFKVSSGIYTKHKLQAVAYSRAIDIAVDRLEIIRIDPDSEKWEISTDEDWNRSRNDLFEEFVGYREMVAEERIEEIYEEATSER